MRASIALIALTSLAGCAPSPKAIVRGTPIIDAWETGTTDVLDPTPALLWNGLVGIRIDRLGRGVPDGWFRIDAYQTEGEEKIQAGPNPLDVRVQIDGKTLALDRIQNYKQSLSLKSGSLTTSFTVDGSSVTSETVLHPTERIVAQRWTIRGPGTATLTYPPTSPSRGFKAAGQLIERQEGDRKVYEYVFATGVSQNRWDILARRGIQVRLRAGWDAPPTPTTFEKVRSAAEAAWAERWKTDIEVDGPVEDQQAIRTFLFYLRSAIHPEGGMSISPFALSNVMYNGHVFWDADIWVFPALAMLEPTAARGIPKYRLAMRSAASRNYRDWLVKRRPTGSQALGPLPNAPTDGEKFPWESSVSGKETVPGPSQFQDHITGSVVFMLRQAAWLGLADQKTVGEAEQAAAAFYQARISRRPDGTYSLKGTMSPDENHTGDDDLYTNLLAQRLLGPKTILRLPKDDLSLLTYEGDPVRSYKQAAAVLAIYPLQDPLAEQQAAQMMQRFADKPIKNGPAMSDSVHATIWARLGRSDLAYRTWQESWKPFTRNGHRLFSEKRNRPNTYFTTGAAGSLQAVLYGFLGMRLDYVPEAKAAWKTKLNGGWLTIRPQLPKEWKRVTLKNFNVLGRRYTLTATPTATSVTSGG